MYTNFSMFVIMTAMLMSVTSLPSNNDKRSLLIGFIGDRQITAGVGRGHLLTKRSFWNNFVDKVKTAAQYTPGVGHIYAGVQKLANDDRGAAETFKKVSGVSGAVVGGTVGFISSGPVGAASAAAASYTLADHAADAINDVAGHPTA